MGLVYIGSGTDVEILDFFKDKELFVFLDSLPRTEYGALKLNKKIRKSFIPKLESAIKNKGFEKVGHLPSLYKDEKAPFVKPKHFDPGLLIYKDGSRVLYYFYSCAYPEPKNKIFTQLLGMCDTLYISGHEPCDNIISKMNYPITFVGSTNTCYTIDEPEELFYQIKNWNNIEELIKDFYSFDVVQKKVQKQDVTFFFE